MLLQAFLKGASLAFYIVIPIGALSVLYIKRTLEEGFLSGFISSFGVTTVEVIYASIAIYGLKFVSEFLLEWKILLQFFGVILMIIIGARTIIFDPKLNRKNNHPNKVNLLKNYLSMAALTLFNPLTIFGFVAVFTSFGANDFEHNHMVQFMMLCGFFSMSFFYCLFLIFLTILVKNKLKASDPKLAGDVLLIQMLSKISGIVIIAFTLLSFLISLIGVHEF